MSLIVCASKREWLLETTEIFLSYCINIYCNYYFGGSVYVYEIANAITKTLKRIVVRNATGVRDQTITTVRRRLSFSPPAIVQYTFSTRPTHWGPRYSSRLSSTADTIAVSRRGPTEFCSASSPSVWEKDYR